MCSVTSLDGVSVVCRWCLGGICRWRFGGVAVVPEVCLCPFGVLVTWLLGVVGWVYFAR